MKNFSNFLLTQSHALHTHYSFGWKYVIRSRESGHAHFAINEIRIDKEMRERESLDGNRTARRQEGITNKPCEIFHLWRILDSTTPLTDLLCVNFFHWKPTWKTSKKKWERKIKRTDIRPDFVIWCHASGWLGFHVDAMVRRCHHDEMDWHLYEVDHGELYASEWKIRFIDVEVVVSPRHRNIGCVGCGRGENPFFHETKDTSARVTVYIFVSFSKCREHFNVSAERSRWMTWWEICSDWTNSRRRRQIARLRRRFTMSIRMDYGPWSRWVVCSCACLSDYRRVHSTGSNRFEKIDEKHFHRIRKIMKLKTSSCLNLGFGLSCWRKIKMA